MQQKPYLVCHNVLYYGITDQEIFFEWIKKIECIERIDGSGDDLYLHLKSSPLTEDELYEIIFLFKRYEIDMKQLKPLLTNENKTLFENSKKAYWYKALFGKD